MPSPAPSPGLDRIRILWPHLQRPQRKIQPPAVWPGPRKQWSRESMGRVCCAPSVSFQLALKWDGVQPTDGTLRTSRGGHGGERQTEPGERARVRPPDIPSAARQDSAALRESRSRAAMAWSRCLRAAGGAGSRTVAEARLPRRETAGAGPFPLLPQVAGTTTCNECTVMCLDPLSRIGRFQLQQKKSVTFSSSRQS